MVHAISWTGSAAAFGYVLQFFRAMIVARLLAPADFGVFGLAFLVLSAVEVFTEFGFSSALIAHRQENEEARDSALNTIWTLDLARRGLLAVLIAATAYPISTYFSDSRLFGVLLAVSPYTFLVGLQNVGLVQLQKELSFKAVALQKQAADVVTTIAVVAIAYFTRNVWALVWAQYVDLAIRVPASYVLCKYRPRLELNRGAIRRGFAFGKHMFVIGVLTYVNTQFDNLVVGRSLGTAVLGAYLVAYRLAMLPVDLLAAVLGTVLFPAYAKVSHERPADLPDLFLKSSNLSAYVLSAIFGVLAIVSTEAIHIVYGRKWDAAIPMLAVLVLVGLFRGITRTVSPVLMALERPDLDAICKAIEVALFIPLTLWGVARAGALGAAWAGVASYSLAYLLRLALAFRVVAVGKARIAFDLLSPLLLAAVCYALACWSRAAGAPAFAAAVLYTTLLSVFAFVSSRLIRKEVRTLIGLILPGGRAGIA